MQQNIWLIPLLPFVSSVILILTAGKLPRKLIATLGAGSVGLAALVVLMLGIEFMGTPTPFTLTLWTWMEVGNFAPGFAFYVDQLTVVMMSVITGVGFLIHLYSRESMKDCVLYTSPNPRDQRGSSMPSSA